MKISCNNWLHQVNNWLWNVTFNNTKIYLLSTYYYILKEWTTLSQASFIAGDNSHPKPIPLYHLFPFFPSSIHIFSPTLIDFFLLLFSSSYIYSFLMTFKEIVFSFSLILSLLFICNIIIKNKFTYFYLKYTNFIKISIVDR